MRKGFAENWLFYCFAIAILAATWVFTLAVMDGRLPYAIYDGRVNLPMEKWEFVLFLVLTIVSGFFGGAYVNKDHYKKDHYKTETKTPPNVSSYSTPDGKPYWP
ncbi:MAG: hypothetical protein Q7S34_02000 [bacterium]|nr:hypothetical protein [bacterium]